MALSKLNQKLLNWHLKHYTKNQIQMYFLCSTCLTQYFSNWQKKYFQITFEVVRHQCDVSIWQWYKLNLFDSPRLIWLYFFITNRPGALSSQIGTSSLHHQGNPGSIGAIGPGLSLSATATPTGSPKRRLPQIPPRGRGPRDTFSRHVRLRMN